MSYSIKLLQLIAFLDLLAVGLIVPLVSNHARRLGASHVSIGLLGSTYAAFQLGSGPLIGSLSDLNGRKKILILSLLICSGAYTVTGLVTSVFSLLCIRAVLGLFKQTQMLTKAMVPDYEVLEENQSQIYGKMAAISGAGITLGPVIGGHILEDFPERGFQYVCAVVGACFLINAGLVYFLPDPVIKIDEKRNKKEEKPRKKASSSRRKPPSMIRLVSQSLQQSVIELYRVDWSKYWEVFTLKALIGFAMSVYYSNYPLYLRTVYDLSPKYIGYIISFQGIIGSFSSYYMGYINSYYHNDYDYSLRNFHVFVLITLSLVGLILSLNVYMYAVWLIPLAVGNAIGRLVTLEMILKRSCGEHRGTLIGASNSVRSLSAVVAPMVSGLISQYFGVGYIIYASLAATLLGLSMSYHCRNISKIKED